MLVLYVQANDYRIPTGQLGGLNASEDSQRAAFPPWFVETSWNNMSIMPELKRMAGGAWYTLSKGLLEYANIAAVSSMQVRSPGAQTATNLTPATSVTASAESPGYFGTADAGNYWYAVTTFRNGNESSMTKTASAVAVAAGQLVKLTIAQGTADADRYLVYRTGKGDSNADANFQRIDQVDVAGASTTFGDYGLFKPNGLGKLYAIVGDAIEAAHKRQPPTSSPIAGIIASFSSKGDSK